MKSSFHSLCSHHVRNDDDTQSEVAKHLRQYHVSDQAFEQQISERVAFFSEIQQCLLILSIV